MAEDNTFLGQGWSFPPTFTANGSQVKVVSNEEDIEQSLRILFATGLSERLMHTQFGCDLKSLLFEEMSNGLVSKVKGIISEAILQHEARIKADMIEVDVDEETWDRLLINITYTVRATNNRYNMVYPFYINEANESF